MTEETHTRGERKIEMFDINNKKLSNTSLYKANSYFKKGYGVWIEEGKKFKLNHEIHNVTPTKKLFDIIFEKQGGKCNISGKKITKSTSELHHKYIPKNIFKCNYYWNLEILDKEVHRELHKNPKLLVNKLIKLGKTINRLKKFDKFIKYHFKRIYYKIKYFNKKKKEC